MIAWAADATGSTLGAATWREPDMNRSRSAGPLALWPLMLGVVFCGVLLAVLPPVVVLIVFPAAGFPLAGFALARSRGGEGILGAMLGGAIGFPTGNLGVVILLSRMYGLPDLSSPVPWAILPALGILGMAWGGLLGSWAWSIARRGQPAVAGASARGRSTVGPTYRPHFVRRRYREL